MSSNTEPPVKKVDSEREYKVIADSVIDGMAVLSVVVLAALGKITGETAVALIMLLAGVWAGKARMRGNLPSPPSSGVILGFASTLWEMFHRRG